jgi:hypothetical protein
VAHLFMLDPVTVRGSVWTEMDSQWKSQEDHGIKWGLAARLVRVATMRGQKGAHSFRSRRPS